MVLAAQFTQTRVRNIFLPVLIAIAASVWLLSNLGSCMLWQDEAQTALLARTTLAHGVPIAFDGPNSISQERGDDYGPHGLWKWHMWLPFYILAGFFKLFGQTTAVARLPFALFGVASVVLSYYTALLLWKDTKSAALTAFLILACIPFALLARQCRYYSPSMFFSLLMFDAYLRICQGSKRSWITLWIAGVLSFNSHFLYCATAWAAIALHAAIWHRNIWKQLLIAAVINGVLCLPPVLWLATLNYRNYSHGGLDTLYIKLQFYMDIKDVFTLIVPYPILILPVISIFGHSSNGRRILPRLADLEPWAWPIFFGCFTLVMSALFSPFPFFRYLGPMIIPLLMLVARMVIRGFHQHLLIGCPALLLLGLWWPLVDYEFELTHQFRGPTEGIVELLKQQGRPGDVVITGYEDLALKFYTPYRIVGGLTGEDLTPATHARWLIPRHHLLSAVEIPVNDFMAKQLSTYHDYQGIVLNVPDTKFENREEPAQHEYASPIDYPPVEVYKRIDPKK
jgi:hypothetical protein